MHTRAIQAALLAAVAILFLTGVASAAQTQLTVRVEGKDRTLFEGPILSEGHDVRAASDQKARHCDSTNLGANPQPAATPTAAAVDAMTIIGEDFDGDWYPGYDDYFVTRWGPDAQGEGSGAFWGVLVNGAFTAVGGCQYRAAPGDEVLWAFDAFSSRPFLRLAATTDPSAAPGPASPTAFVEQGQPLSLIVESYTGAMDGAPESIQPVAGALVAPVATDPVKGFEEVEASDPSTVATASDGTTPVSFPTPGWHRLKATKGGYVRSNRLDVCVEPVGGGDCGPLPADAQARKPPASPPPEAAATPPSPGGASPSVPLTPPGSLSLVRVRANRESGGVVLTISVSGPGRLTLSGGKVRKRSVWASAAGTLPLGVAAKGRALSRLRRRGKVAVAVTIAFTPLVGSVTATHRSVVLKLGEAAG